MKGLFLLSSLLSQHSGLMSKGPDFISNEQPSVRNDSSEDPVTFRQPQHNKDHENMTVVLRVFYRKEKIILQNDKLLGRSCQLVKKC